MTVVLPKTPAGKPHFAFSSGQYCFFLLFSLANHTGYNAVDSILLKRYLLRIFVHRGNVDGSDWSAMALVMNATMLPMFDCAWMKYVEEDHHHKHRHSIENVKRPFMSLWA